MKRYYLELFRHTLTESEEEAWVDILSLGIHPDLVESLAGMGIVDVRYGHIPARQVSRLHKLLRLRCSLGVNLAGAAVILDLMERMEALQEEIDQLRGR